MILKKRRAKYTIGTVKAILELISELIVNDITINYCNCISMRNVYVDIGINNNFEKCMWYKVHYIFTYPVKLTNIISKSLKFKICSTNATFRLQQNPSQRINSANQILTII